jgi:hypothetical protein
MARYKRKFLIKELKAENNKLYFIAEDDENRYVKVYYHSDKHHKIRQASLDFINNQVVKMKVLEIEEIEQLSTENKMREFNLISISDVAKSDIVLFKEKLLELNPFYDCNDCHATYLEGSRLLEELRAEARNSEIKKNLLKKHLCQK